MHRDEARKPTNTGSLAARCLVGSEVLIHGVLGQRLQPPWLSGENQQIVGGLLLYPSDEAEPLSRDHLERGPVRLVVPDGTWRQAAKMPQRIPWMKEMKRVSLPPGAETSYRLRSEPKQGGLATMEAIARAFAVLEGKQVEAQLDDIFRRMIDRTLYSRGEISRDEVYGGVPEGVQRHSPTSGRA